MHACMERGAVLTYVYACSSSAHMCISDAVSERLDRTRPNQLCLPPCRNCACASQGKTFNKSIAYADQEPLFPWRPK